MAKKVIIQVNNNNCRLTTNDPQIRLKLWKILRFRERGYYHSTLYKQKKWDGYVDFFNKDSGLFLTGLLPEVKYALKYWSVNYEIIDLRKPLKLVTEEIDIHFLEPYTPKDEPKPITLYDYQADLVTQALKYRRGVIQAPTSAGKTYIMIGLLKALPPKTPVLFLANRKSLVEQNYDEMIKWGIENVGRVYDKYFTPNYVTCATVQSLHKIEKLIPKIRVLVVDEIHENMTKTAKKFYKKMESCCMRVAVSATPFKYGGQHKTQKYAVKGYFGPIFKTSIAGEDGLLTTEKLQDRKILSGSKCIIYPICQPQIPYEVYLDAVTLGIAENVYFHKVVTGLARILEGRTLILVERLEHGDTLNNMLPGSLWVQGKDNLQTRKQVISQLKKTHHKCIAIATQGIFNAGINVKVHNLINAAGGQADHQIVQRMGRGLRTAEDKDILNYYDFWFKINEYLEGHSKKRIKILKAEGHEVEIREEIDFPI